VEWNFALNYLSRFVLTRGLLPLLRAAGRPGRAARIMTAGGAVRNGRIDYHDVTFESGFSFFRSVSQVAHANDVWAVELARRLDPSVTIACLKFGAIRTGTRRSFPRWLRWTLAALVDPLIGRSAAEAGAAAARVATDPALESKTGTLFELVTKLRPIEPGPRVRDPEEGRRLWELSERLA
jgi:NAD(P)-dependent dehydrogenase (short-subunit alcohol dehydrogenase family)